MNIEKPPAQTGVLQGDRLSCPHCGRSFAVTRFDMHVRVCANALPFRESVKALDECGPAPIIGDKGAISGAFCAESVQPVARTICTLCGRHFANERLPTHRRVCALQLPSFRAQVAAVEAVEHEDEVLSALTQRALSAERRLAEESALRAEAEQRAELAKAASRSIEAAYDVLSDALAEREKRVAELSGRAEAAEQKAEEARRKAELAEAGAKSIEAAYDVMAEALANAEKKIEKLRGRLSSCNCRDRRLRIKFAELRGEDGAWVHCFYRSSKNLGTPHPEAHRPRRQGGEDRSDMTTLDSSLSSCWTLYR